MPTIFVTMSVKPDDMAEFEAGLAELVRVVRESEPDTLRFESFRVPDTAGAYRMLLTCRSREALDFHSNNPATATERGLLRRLLISPPSVRPLAVLESL